MSSLLSTAVRVAENVYATVAVDVLLAIVAEGTVIVPVASPLTETVSGAK
jgi:hypothetical protein